MKIDTELVKNKKFTTPIKAELQKHQQEYRVLATLRYLFPNRFEKMITGESPDLHDSENNIGIEVTSAVNWKDMRASREFANFKYRNKNIEKYKQAIASSGYSFTHIQDSIVGISTFGTTDGEKIFFQESIQRKLNKLQKYKVKFNKIGLAVILPEIPTLNAEEHFCEWIAEEFERSDALFDFVYVISHRFCIYYDVHNKLSRKLELKSEYNKYLCTLARMTAEGELSLNDLEWK